MTDYQPRYREEPVYRNGALIGFCELGFDYQVRDVLKIHGIDFDRVYNHPDGVHTYYNCGEFNVATFCPNLGIVSVMRRFDPQ